MGDGPTEVAAVTDGASRPPSQGFIRAGSLMNFVKLNSIDSNK
jgi:hypothetical protein